MARTLEELDRLPDRQAKHDHVHSLLNQSRETACEVLTDSLRFPHYGWVLDLAVRHLGHLADPQAVDIALAYLESTERHRAGYAARLLGLARAERAVPVLAAHVAGGARVGSAGRPEAYWALERIGTPVAHAALLAAVRLTDPRSTYELAVEAVCRVGTPEAVDEVLRLSATTRLMWGSNTLAAVAKIADERFTPFLLEACVGPHRHIALAGLGRAASERAMEPLGHIFFTTPDRRERRVVAAAIAHSCAEHELIMVRNGPRRHDRDSDALLWRDIAWLLGQVVRTDSQWHRDAKYQARLLCAELLEHDDPLVRAQAARSLTRLGRSEHSVPHLEQRRPIPGLLSGLLADPSYRVRAAAGAALASVGTKAALPRLREVAIEDAVACVRDAAGAAVRRLA
ncbi:HEAT repeat domain-containing protein [Actinospica robiniae]|uniref:HEAT repeat domain-containing protein n=1 Tax=Actinospica robiniae TaxID=304901 RepID=UPI00041F1BF5|nr:HEAT repeat domain-containing protein [Actinospica robiniae]